MLGDGGGGLAARAASSPPTYPETVGEVFAPDVLREFASWLWPAIPITTFVLSLTHRVYRGLAGVVRGLILTAISLPGSLLLPLAILVGWEQRITGIGGFADFGAALLGLGVLVLVHALVGGLLGGAVLFAASRRGSGPDGVSPWRAYGTAVLALIVWGAVARGVGRGPRGDRAAGLAGG